MADRALCRAGHGFGRAVVPHGDRLRVGVCGFRTRDLLHQRRVDIARHAEHEICGRVKCCVAVLQDLRGDLADGFDRSGDRNADGVMREHRAEQVLIGAGVGAVLIHADLLRDDAALLFHALRREPRREHHAQQDAEVFGELFGAVEIIGRHGIAGEGVRIAAVGREEVHRVVLRQIEHLVLQIVRHAIRRAAGDAAAREGRINGAVVHAEEGVAAGKAGLRDDAEEQAVFKPLLPVALAEAREFMQCHASSPFRK